MNSDESGLDSSEIELVGINGSPIMTPSTGTQNKVNEGTDF